MNVLDFIPNFLVKNIHVIGLIHEGTHSEIIKMSSEELDAFDGEHTLFRSFSNDKDADKEVDRQRCDSFVLSFCPNCRERSSELKNTSSEVYVYKCTCGYESEPFVYGNAGCIATEKAFPESFKIWSE